jgi:phage baseplate assembly protein gpV
MDRNISFKIVKSMLDNIKQTINTLFLAIVEEYNVETGRITVIPKLKMLDNYGNYIDRAMLFECPTCCIKAQNFYLRIPYKKGDIVYVGCSQEALDDLLLNGETSATNLDGVSRFRLTDAVILGGIFVDTENKMTSENPDDFIIQNRDNNDIIILKKSGGVQVKTSSKFQIDASEVEINADTMNMNVGTTTTNGNSITQNVSTTTNTGNVEVTGALKAGTIDSTGKGISLDNHTHTYQKPEHVAGTESTSVAK